MRRFLASMGIAGLLAFGMASDAAAQGGAYGALLDPTTSAIDCAVTTPCESDGYGSAATLKIGRANYLGFDLSNLIAGQTYIAANNDVGLGSCAGMLTSFVTGPAGGANFSWSVDSAADFVSICREADGMLLPILTGQMARLNGR